MPRHTLADPGGLLRHIYGFHIPLGVFPVRTVHTAHYIAYALYKIIWRKIPGKMTIQKTDCAIPVNVFTKSFPLPVDKIAGVSDVIGIA